MEDCTYCCNLCRHQNFHFRSCKLEWSSLFFQNTLVHWEAFVSGPAVVLVSLGFGTMSFCYLFDCVNKRQSCSRTMNCLFSCCLAPWKMLICFLWSWLNFSAWAFALAGFPLVFAAIVHFYGMSQNVHNLVGTWGWQDKSYPYLVLPMCMAHVFDSLT